eukprot:Gb_21160 [translate_table: standard]
MLRHSACRRSIGGSFRCARPECVSHPPTVDPVGWLAGTHKRCLSDGLSFYPRHSFSPPLVCCIYLTMKPFPSIAHDRIPPLVFSLSMGFNDGSFGW